MTFYHHDSLSELSYDETMKLERMSDSHKGENGKVAILGGSRPMHGAPILCSLAAEASGADLIYPIVPECHCEVTKAASYNFIVSPLSGCDMREPDVESVLEILATMDCAVIGPGLARDAKSLACLSSIVASVSCPMVLDASALQSNTLKLIAGKQVILTPHLGELERMEIKEGEISEIAQNHALTLLLKGPVDHLALPDGSVEEICGGNAGLTVGGTGDVLAGLIGGLIAQGVDTGEAARTASTIVKRAGTVLVQEKGYAYTARDTVEIIPELLHQL